jgi:hypothetical protein
LRIEANNALVIWQNDAPFLFALVPVHRMAWNNSNWPGCGIHNPYDRKYVRIASRAVDAGESPSFRKWLGTQGLDVGAGGKKIYLSKKQKADG